MNKSFEKIKMHLQQSHYSKLLYRATSGMGVSIPFVIDENTKFVFNCFAEDEEYIRKLKKSLTTTSKIKSIIGRFLPRSIKEQIKKVVRI